VKGDKECDPRRGPSPVEGSPSHISPKVDGKLDENGIQNVHKWYYSVRKCNSRESRSGRGHGTEHNLKFCGSVTERPPSVDTE